jgi:MFS family permease
VLVDGEIVRLILRHPAVIRASLVFGGFVVGYVTAHEERVFGLRWFEVVAQVIPVLLLALAIEIRVFEFSPELRRRIRFNPAQDLGEVKRRLENPRLAEFMTRLMLAPVLILLVFGEVLALNVLGEGRVDSKFDQGIIAGSIVAGLVMICIAALVGTSKAPSPPSEP